MHQRQTHPRQLLASVLLALCALTACGDSGKSNATKAEDEALTPEADDTALIPRQGALGATTFQAPEAP
ncbi:MAG: hypothetical protein ACI841_000259 [Planctomycetota bacterium]|jgi:hypothetical protein